MTPPSDPNSNQGLSPNGLAEQLFNAALMQNPSDPRLVARNVIGFLMNSLMYALNASKNDPIVFLTEALVNVVASSSEDDAARREVLKYISAMLAQAADQAPVAPQTSPTPTPGAPPGKP